ncbi:MAG: glycosyltransferase family 4 protein, partial [Elusimicrobia bacterium]|nr:glycosyltransferase family 4 protein [Elusimicrobiota bacterium]
MRLAIVCREARGFGGTTRILVENARHFVSRGWRVDVLAARFERERFEGTGARLRRVPTPPWGSRLKRSWFAAAADRLGRAYDLVHGHGDNLEQDVLSLHNCVHAAYEAVHGVELPDTDAVGRLHAMQLRQRRFKLLICNSALMAEELRRRFAVPGERLRVIHPGYDPERFRAEDRGRLREQARAELSLGRDELVVGLITSGDFEKRGLPYFLRAVAELKRKGLSFKALVVGKEKRMGPYLALASQLGLAETVLFREPRLEVERFYHCLDVYCHPALYEEFGMSVQEAMACGLPVVCGRRVGAAELFGPGMRRLLADPRQPELAARLHEALSSKELRAS